MSSEIIVLFGILFAYELKSVVTGLEIFWKISSMMGIAFGVGLFWRRATVAGAWISTLASFFVLLFTSKLSIGNNTFWDFNKSMLHLLPDYMAWDGKIYLPWQMIFYLTAGILAMITVSLLSKPVNKEKLDEMYSCIRTPIIPGEPETRPLQLPEGVEAAPREVLFQHPDFEIPRPTRLGMAGFLISWLFVALIIIGTYWIFSIGA